MIDHPVSGKNLLLATLGLMMLAACGNDERSTDSNATPNTDAGVGTDVSTDGSSAPAACAEEDDFAPNQSQASAYEMTAGAFDERNLYLCAGTDDFFRLFVNAGQAAEVLINGEGFSLDVLLDDGTEFAGVGRERTPDGQLLRFVGPDAGGLTLRVSGENAVRYSLQVNLGCTTDADCGSDGACSLLSGECAPPLDPICGDDGLEPNDRIADAVPIELSPTFTANGLVVCEEDDDYFRFTLSTASTIQGGLYFDEGNDLDVALYTPDGTLVDVSATEDPATEFWTWRALPAGDYVLVVDDKVTGLGLDVGYSLDLLASPEGCESDNECAVAAGRSVCVDGGCVTFAPEQPSVAGGPCDDSDDCAGDLGCYTSGGSFSENFCTRNCESAADCGDFDDGYCLGFGRTGVCFDACSTALDCPDFTDCDASTGRCEFIGCNVDADCGDDAVCRRSEENQGLCSRPEVLTCSESDAAEPNDAQSGAFRIDDPTDTLRNLTICDADEDWYVFPVDVENAELVVRVQSDTGSDIDVYIYNQDGRAVGAGTTPDGNPETARARRVGAGDYYIRVDQFPREEEPDVLTRYSIEIEIAADDACTLDGEECWQNNPLRFICDETTGSCDFTDGNGTVGLGELCDASSDCTEDAEFCWTYSRPQDRQNICTRRCGGGDNCGDVPGAECVEFRNGAAFCLPR